MTEQAAALRAQNIILAGASGTIGRALALTLMADGHDLTCLVRASDTGRAMASDPQFAPAHFAFVERYERHGLAELMAGPARLTVISCLASRSGERREAQAIDYAANGALLEAAEQVGARQFISLSAICLQYPQLAFQHAKLAFEERLMKSDVAHTIIRPTAYFKSLSGQIDRVARGKPFLLFGDGELTRCTPIGDADLARYIADSVGDADRMDRTLPIGGPGPAISLREQGELLFELTGQTPRYKRVPVRMFDVAIAALSLPARWSGRVARACEYARIGRYYATQSMLVRDPATGRYRADLTPAFGTQTLRDHYARVLSDAER